jgi:hypothetical protein
MVRKAVDVAVIIPDASPVLTLGRIGRIDLLGSFSVPVQIVDQVHYEITKPENDPSGEVAAGLKGLHNHFQIIETNVGVGYQARRARDPNMPSGTMTATQKGPNGSFLKIIAPNSLPRSGRRWTIWPGNSKMKSISAPALPANLYHKLLAYKISYRG